MLKPRSQAALGPVGGIQRRFQIICEKLVLQRMHARSVCAESAAPPLFHASIRSLEASSVAVPTASGEEEDGRCRPRTRDRTSVLVTAGCA